MDDEEIIYLCWGGVETMKIPLIANYECLPPQIQKCMYRFVINIYSYKQGWFLSLLCLLISFVWVHSYCLQMNKFIWFFSFQLFLCSPSPWLCSCSFLMQVQLSSSFYLSTSMQGLVLDNGGALVKSPFLFFPLICLRFSENIFLITLKWRFFFCAFNQGLLRGNFEGHGALVEET
jgi:hypothetical protein